MAEEENKHKKLNIVFVGLIIGFFILLFYFLLNSINNPSLRFNSPTSSYGFVDKAYSMFGKA